MPYGPFLAMGALLYLCAFQFLWEDHLEATFGYGPFLVLLLVIGGLMFVPMLTLSRLIPPSPGNPRPGTVGPRKMAGRRSIALQCRRTRRPVAGTLENRSRDRLAWERSRSWPTARIRLAGGRCLGTRRVSVGPSVAVERLENSAVAAGPLQSGVS